MIITIDGPAGAGKSTVAKLLAQKLGFQFLDTGAMYRAVAWAVLNSGGQLSDSDHVTEIAESIVIRFDQQLVFVDDEDVTECIRQKSINAAVSEVADNVDVRKILVRQQQVIASQGNFVCEGRDQGTVAFPNAECKIFLTATSNERARRRFVQMVEKGLSADFEEVLTAQEVRDQRDLQRSVGGLAKAEDAVEVLTDGLSLNEVVDKIEQIFRSKTTG